MENFHCPKSPFCSACSFLPTLWEPPAAADLSLVSIALPFPGCHIVGLTQYVAFLDGLLSLSNMRLRFFHVFSWAGSSFLSSRITFHRLEGPRFVYPSPAEGPLAACTCWQLRISCCKPPWARFCVRVSLQLFRVNTKEHNCWIAWWEYVYFINRNHSTLLKWLHHVSFLPAMGPRRH